MTALEYFESIYPGYDGRNPLGKNEIIATMQDYVFHVKMCGKSMSEIADITARDVLTHTERKKIRTHLINDGLCEKHKQFWNGQHIMRPSVEHYYESGWVSGRLRLTIEQIMEDYRKRCKQLYDNE